MQPNHRRLVALLLGIVTVVLGAIVLFATPVHTPELLGGAAITAGLGLLVLAL
jgi:uncharacterized membrane protein